MATALCKLQLELKCSSSIEDFQSRTPPITIREHKRERSKRSVHVKLEARFLEDKLEDPGLAGGGNDLKILETNKASSGLPSVASEASITSDSLELSEELSLSNDPDLESCIGDFPMPEELASLDEDFLAKSCNLGYRAKRIVMLARSIVEEKVCLQKLEEMRKIFAEEASSIGSTYERLNKELSMISGFGPFTRANVLMCMGFFHTIPADTETIRHLKQVPPTPQNTHMRTQTLMETLYFF